MVSSNISIVRISHQFDTSNTNLVKMIVLLTVENALVSTAIWLFSVKYYETASDIECLLQKTSLMKNRIRKKRLRNATAVILVLDIAVCIAANVATLSHDFEAADNSYSLAPAIEALFIMFFYIMMLAIMAIAFSKLIKLIQGTKGVLLNNWLICA